MSNLPERVPPDLQAAATSHGQSCILGGMGGLAPQHLRDRWKRGGDLHQTYQRLSALVRLVADLRLVGVGSSLHVSGNGEAVLMVPRPLGKPLAVLCSTSDDRWYFTWGNGRAAWVEDSMAVATEIREALS